MWIIFKNWIRRPIIIVGMICLLVSGLAQKKDYWKHFNLPEAFGNLFFFLQEERPLDLVLVDTDPDSHPIVNRAYTTPQDEVLKVESSYQNPHLRFLARGRVIEVVDESLLGAEATPQIDESPYSLLFLKNGKILFWVVQLALAWLFFSPIRFFWMKLLGLILLFTFLETVRVWNGPGYCLCILLVLSAIFIQWKNKALLLRPSFTKETAWAVLFALPCLVLALQAVAHPELHWDAADYWLPRGYFIALHDTLFFNGIYSPHAMMPTYQGYPPLWSSLLSVPFSVLPQFAFAVGPLLLFLILAALSEYLLSRSVPWPYVLAAANFSFIYLYIHCQFAYAQAITAAGILLFCWVIIEYRASPWYIFILIFCGLLIPLTRMESIVYLWALLPLGLLLGMNWKPLLSTGLIGLGTMSLWFLTAKHYGMGTPSGLAKEGAMLLLDQSLWDWIKRLYFIMEYKMIRKKFNAEHYMMLVFLLSWFAAKRPAFKKYFLEWRSIWAFFILMWGVLLFLYFPVPVMDLKEMERIYLGTGFFRMYSHFVPALFLFLPTVLFVAFKDKQA